MRSMEEIYEELNGLIGEGRWTEIEPFLRGRMDEAREEESNGVYVAAGNELLSFYRQSGQYEKAFAVSEDILLLMEELNLEDTEHFALVLMSTGAAYEGAGRPYEAERCYARAVRIMDGKKGGELLLAEALTRQGLLALAGAERQEAQEPGMNQAEPFPRPDQAKPLLPEQAEQLLVRAEELFAKVEEEHISQEGKDGAPDDQAAIYRLTALSGMGEAAFRRKDYVRSLACYKKAAEKSASLFGASEGTRLFWKNCAAVCAALSDPEKEAHYRAMADGASGPKCSGLPVSDGLSGTKPGGNAS